MGRERSRIDPSDILCKILSLRHLRVSMVMGYLGYGGAQVSLPSPRVHSGAAPFLGGSGGPERAEHPHLHLAAWAAPAPAPAFVLIPAAPLAEPAAGAFVGLPGAYFGALWAAEPVSEPGEGGGAEDFVLGLPK